MHVGVDHSNITTILREEDVMDLFMVDVEEIRTIFHPDITVKESVEK